MGRTHRDLLLWSESIGLVKHVYAETRTFPKEEANGISGQMRRASISIPSNVAEGAACGNKKEFIRFLTIARGSLSELDTLLVIASEIELLDGQRQESLRDKTMHVSILLNGLIRALQKIGKN